MLDLPGKQAYEIFDERIFQLHRDAPGLRSLGRLLDAGLLLKAETPADLAAKLGINAEGLKETVHECNALAARGEKDAFGRVLPQPLAGPYYGIKVTVALYHTQGGLKVNADGQVIRIDGSIIPNLYAGGGVAVGVSGRGLEGYLPGNGLLASLGLGMIAAEHAVASVDLIS
jgi:fumarate reductase flavoprotein subunit